ncbi:MAG: hypothetical protein AAF664_03565 [Planctomycetota bacterium]
MDDLKLAKQEFEANDYRLASQFAMYVLAREPEHPEALWIQGIACLRDGNFADGVEALELLSLVKPIDEPTRIDLAVGYGKLGKTDLACYLLVDLVESKRLTTDELLKAAEGFHTLGECRLAMEACRRAGKQSPRSGQAHYQMAIYATACGRSNEVIEALLRHSIDLQPGSVDFRLGLASFLIRSDRNAEALSVMEPVVPSKLKEIHCVCCIRRIANLFFDFDDLKRAKACSARCKELQIVKSVGKSPNALSQESGR